MRYIYDKFEEIVLVVLLILMSIIMGLQIIFRHILGSSIVWSEELVRYMFICSTFIGVSYSIKKKSMLSVLLFVNKLPNKYNSRIERLINYLNIIVCGTFSVFSLNLVIEYVRSSQRSPALNMPLWILYLSVFVGMFFSVIRSIENLFEVGRLND